MAKEYVSVRTWLDLEQVVPASQHQLLRLYRLFQQINRTDFSCGGCLPYAVCVEQAVSALELTPRRAKAMLEMGMGVFWTRTAKGKIRLIGYRRLCARFNILPSEGKGIDIPLWSIKGHIANFRGLVYAAKVQGMLYSWPYFESSRDDMAKRLGITRQTLRRYVDENWIVCIPQLEVLIPNVDVRIGNSPFIVGDTWRKLDRSKGERRWRNPETNLRSLVRQDLNLYSTIFVHPDLRPQVRKTSLFNARVLGEDSLPRIKYSVCPPEFVCPTQLEIKPIPSRSGWVAFQ